MTLFPKQSNETDNQLQNKGIFVQYQKNGIDGDGLLHLHMGYEIYLFYKGNAKVIIGDQVYPLQKGDMILIPGQIPHISKPDKDSPYIRSIIHFLDTPIRMFPNKILEPILHMFQNNGLLIHCDINDQHEIEKLVSKMNTELNKDEFGNETMAATILFELLVLVYRKVQAMNNQSQYRHLTQQEMYVEQILSIINSKYNEEMDLDFIANSININKHYMCHCFKDVTGYTITTYIQHKRMEEAKKLLQFSPESMTYIGQSVGIRNVSHFSRLFKEYSGITPSDFRKKYNTMLKKQFSIKTEQL
ncbi:helix-turn-helix domain-containing protein [Neobacillus sp. Marseille-QA0830]